MSRSPRPRESHAPQVLAQHRAFTIANRWLTVLLVSWIVALVSEGSVKIAAFLVLAVAFFKLMTTLPFPRDARIGLSWCATFGVTSAFYELLPTLETSPSGPARAAWFLFFAVLIAATLFAFTTSMRALAQLAGSPASVQQWTSVQKWQLGVWTVVVLVAAAAFPIASGTADFTVESPLAMFAVLLLAGALVGVLIVYPAIAIVRLQRHLRERFDPWSLVERGELVLRDEASSLTYQASAPPWESSTAHIAAVDP